MCCALNCPRVPHLQAAESSDKWCNDFLQFQQQCCQKFRIQTDHLAHFIVLNWAAPSTVRNHILGAQAAWAGNLILRYDSIGAAIMPVFSYKTGNLWIVQNAQTQALVNSGLLVDHQWTLNFVKKARLSCWIQAECVCVLSLG